VCRLEASSFPLGKHDYKSNMLFLVFIVFFKMFIVLLLKFIKLLLVVGVHCVVVSC